jgi:hypothetical protein
MGWLAADAKAAGVLLAIFAIIGGALFAPALIPIGIIALVIQATRKNREG